MDQQTIPPNEPAEKSTVDIRKSEQKQQLIEQIKKTPIVQVACEKVGISRMTYYRWHKEDQEFADSIDTAVAEGAGLVNDMAESQLMTAIKNGNLSAIMFWLKHHHKTYATKVEVTANLKQPVEELTPEQQALVEQALKLASLVPDDSPNTSEDADADIEQSVPALPEGGKPNGS